MFRCRVTGDPTPTVVWQKGKWKAMENNATTRIYFDENTGRYRNTTTSKAWA